MNRGKGSPLKVSLFNTVIELQFLFFRAGQLFDMLRNCLRVYGGNSLFEFFYFFVCLWIMHYDIDKTALPSGTLWSNDCTAIIFSLIYRHAYGDCQFYYIFTV